MKLEDQVCSLELAKKLKELGLNKKSLFAWFFISHKDKWELSSQTENDLGLPAYTVAELGEFLLFTLNEYILSEDFIDLIITKNSLREWEYCYNSEKTGTCYPFIVDKSEANARAYLLIWLIENGHVKP